MDVPLSSEARHFYKSGPPFLTRYLPFWFAVLVERLLILLIPLLGLLYPLLQTAPKLYNDAMERRILALYGQLKFLEGEVERGPSAGNAPALVARLDDLEGKAGRLRVPMKFSQSLYHLRAHIDFVRERIAVRKDGEPG